MFAALLDERQGGRFQVAPLFDQARQKQLYLPDSCVLLTRFLSDAGVAEVSDFMPIAETKDEHDIVRRVKTVRGEVRFRMICQGSIVTSGRLVIGCTADSEGRLEKPREPWPKAAKLRYKTAAWRMQPT